MLYHILQKKHVPITKTSHLCVKIDDDIGICKK